MAASTTLLVFSYGWDTCFFIACKCKRKKDNRHIFLHTGHTIDCLLFIILKLSHSWRCMIVSFNITV